MDVEFKWNKPVQQVVNESSGGKKGLLFLAKEAKKLMDPYVPADSFVLTQNVRVYAEGDIGIVHYQSPYAHYQYEGVVYGPNYPVFDGGEVVGFYSPPHKTPTGKKLNHSKARHPLATSKWDKAMKTAHKGELARRYQNYLKG